jgi:hypothetical protein
MAPSSFKITLPVLALLMFPISSALALPPADGSKCSANWVNNASAMACFTQGEEESRNGTKHPHYVACTAAGEVFCCVDDDHGNQNCEVAEASTGGGHPKIWVQGILAAQGAHLKALGKTPAPSTGTVVKPGPAKTEQ